MKVCPNCFSDIELKAFLSARVGQENCVVCNSSEVPLTEIAELVDFFQEMIDCFVPSAQGEQFVTRIQGNWGLFSNRTVAATILNHVLPQLNTEVTHDSSAVDFHPEILENVGFWDQLKEDLKWSRRFLTDFAMLTEDLGWDEFFGTQRALTSKDRLFRARVHHESGRKSYVCEEMMAPQREKAWGGRANSFGIPVLYLADSIETTLYEVRAAYLDEVSVGEFGLKPHIDSLTVVDFTEHPTLYRPGKVNKTVKAYLLKGRISQELSKPMRRYDTEIEYIPTQFICEFIRVVTGAGGIMFASSLHPSGKNVVIFDQHLMSCLSVELHRVNRLELKSLPI